MVKCTLEIGARGRECVSSAGGGISVSSTLKPVVLIRKVTCEQGPEGEVGGSHHRLLGKGKSMYKGLS